MKKTKTVVMQFSFLAVVTNAGGVTNFSCTPGNLSPRAGAEADGFTYYRLRSLRFRYINNTTTAAASAMGVIGGQPNTLPANTGQVGELLDSTCRPPSPSAIVILTAWSEWVNVRKEILAGPLPWYNTFNGSFAAEFDAPCTMCIAGGTTDSYLYQLKFTLEFKDAANTANTPVALELRDRQREERRRRLADAERKTLLRVLAPDQNKTA